MKKISGVLLIVGICVYGLISAAQSSAPETNIIRYLQETPPAVSVDFFRSYFLYKRHPNGLGILIDWCLSDWPPDQRMHFFKNPLHYLSFYPVVHAHFRYRAWLFAQQNPFFLSALSLAEQFDALNYRQDGLGPRFLPLISEIPQWHSKKVTVLEFLVQSDVSTSEAPFGGDWFYAAHPNAWQVLVHYCCVDFTEQEKTKLLENPCYFLVVNPARHRQFRDNACLLAKKNEPVFLYDLAVAEYLDALHGEGAAMMSVR